MPLTFCPQILFEHLKVFAGKRLQMVVIAHEGRRLQLVDQIVGAPQPPWPVLLVPDTVEPNARHRPVFRKQLRQLIVHVVEVLIEVSIFGTARIKACSPTREILILVPIQM